MPKISFAFRAPLYLCCVQAGFPSSGKAYIEETIDLNELFIRCKALPFFMSAATAPMKDEGIFPRDLLIIDRSLNASHGNIIVAVLNGQ